MLERAIAQVRLTFRGSLPRRLLDHARSIRVPTRQPGLAKASRDSDSRRPRSRRKPDRSGYRLTHKLLVCIRCLAARILAELVNGYPQNDKDEESKAARLSLIPYRTRKSEKMSGNGESRVVDLVWAGIDSRKAGQVTMSKERLFVERKGKGVTQSLNENPAILILSSQ